MCGLQWRTDHVLRRGLFFMLIFMLLNSEGNTYQNNIGVSAKQFIVRVHTLFYFLHDITNP